jgi:hypothetical protein
MIAEGITPQVGTIFADGDATVFGTDTGLGTKLFRVVNAVTLGEGVEGSTGHRSDF